MRAPTTIINQQGKSAENTPGFTLTLQNFEGPFDLLLSLISRRKLDITDVALAEVTDEFLHYINQLFESQIDTALDQASDFLVTAATLLDLKAARLLPRGQVESEEDVALLEARDLLFARLLQYRAYRDVAGILAERYDSEAQRFPRDVALEPQFAQVLPELVFETSPEEFAQIAAKALSASHFEDEPHENLAQVELGHLHQPLTTIADEENFIVQRLVENSQESFSNLIRGCGEFEIAVYRFLAVLELIRNGAVEVTQANPLGEISVSAVGEKSPVPELQKEASV